MTIELYSKPMCVQCNQSKKTLDKLGLKYVTADVTEDANAYEFVTATLGYKAAPVLVIKNEAGEVVNSWSGFQPEKIEALVS